MTCQFLTILIDYYLRIAISAIVLFAYQYKILADISEPENGDYYAVLCGISDYEDDSGFPDLDYCDDDVIALNKTFQEWPNWKSEYIQTFIDEDSSKDVILNEIGIIFNNMNGSDTFVFHFSGHGTTVTDFNGDEDDGKDEALCMYNGNTITDDELSDIIANCPTSRWLIIIDACYSGGLIRQLYATRTFGINVRGVGTDGIKDGFFEDIKPQIGIRALGASNAGVVLSACAANETASETDELSHGIFSYYLIEALRKGYGADSNTNSWLSAEELYSYAKPRVYLYRFSQNAQMQDDYYGELDICSLLNPRSKFSILHQPAGIQPIHSGQRYADLQSLTDFGCVNVGSSKTIEYKIINSGLADLIVDNIGISGSDAFSLVNLNVSFVVSGETATFRISFHPLSEGEHSANITILNNDKDETSFEFSVFGIGKGPD